MPKVKHDYLDPRRLLLDPGRGRLLVDPGHGRPTQPPQSPHPPKPVDLAKLANQPELAP